MDGQSVPRFSVYLKKSTLSLSTEGGKDTSFEFLLKWSFHPTIKTFYFFFQALKCQEVASPFQGQPLTEMVPLSVFPPFSVLDAFTKNQVLQADAQQFKRWEPSRIRSQQRVGANVKLLLNKQQGNLYLNNQLFPKPQITTGSDLY